jgi:nicotinate-nucleotide adenylyltransferase
MFHSRSGTSTSGLRIGLLGGSFNPAHAGHRDISLFALKRLGLDQVWWLVSPQNPLKPTHDMAPLAERMNNARAVSRHPRIRVTDIETQLGTRYTVDTLKALRTRFPHTHFVWLMGADNMQQLPKWRHWADIFALVPVAVFRRPDYAAGRNLGKAAYRFSHAWRRAAGGVDLMESGLPAWTILDNRLNKLSATNIRKDRDKWRK